ncbi:MAG TPA: hypothetical protein VEL31_21185 [Ktedonobacteraceae bacterium]|nr:hypothetical protein [Ktedonobacteraceae bacterium]
MQWAVLTASFLASAVEFVEAFTIVLVVGVTINWRSALAGAFAAAATLALIVATLGVALVRYVPIDILRLAVGIILILFGLKWLKKAILRYSGLKALHDEEAIFEETRAELRARGENIAPRFEPFGVALAYKAVLLEGLEVAFIVITFGSSSATNACNTTCGIGSAAIGAAIAGILVILAGAIIKAPLTKIPENTLKFIVGIMLTSFGTFWGGEGFGITWPFSDAFIPVLAVIYLLASFILVMILRQSKQRRIAEANVDQSAVTTPEQEVLQ